MKVVEILCIIVDMLRWKVAQWFELLWWKRYLGNKNKSEYLEWKMSYWRKLLSEVFGKSDLPTDKSIIDLGCGPSGVYMVFPNHHVVAVDPLLEKYESDLSLFGQTDYPNVVFKGSTIESYSDNTKYDYVFCLNAINHVADIEVAYKKMSSLLAESGLLVFSIDAHNYSFFKKIFRAVPGDILHPHQYDLVEYKQMLGAVGLKVQKIVKLKHEFFFDHYVLLASKTDPTS